MDVSKVFSNLNKYECVNSGNLCWTCFLPKEKEILFLLSSVIYPHFSLLPTAAQDWKILNPKLISLFLGITIKSKNKENDQDSVDSPRDTP